MKDILCEQDTGDPVIAAEIAKRLDLIERYVDAHAAGCGLAVLIATKARPVGERNRLSVPTMVRASTARQRK
jgi:hypothetical protein